MTEVKYTKRQKKIIKEEKLETRKSGTEFVCHIVKLLFLIFSAFQELISSTFWIAIVKIIRIFGGDH
jgi:hypothetical protein